MVERGREEGGGGMVERGRGDGGEGEGREEEKRSVLSPPVDGNGRHAGALDHSHQLLCFFHLTQITGQRSGCAEVKGQ